MFKRFAQEKNRNIFSGRIIFCGFPNAYSKKIRNIQVLVFGVLKSLKSMNYMTRYACSAEMAHAIIHSMGRCHPFLHSFIFQMSHICKVKAEKYGKV